MPRGSRLPSLPRLLSWILALPHACVLIISFSVFHRQLISVRQFFLLAECSLLWGHALIFVNALSFLIPLSCCLYFFWEFPRPPLFMPSSLFLFESAFLSLVLDAFSDVGDPGSVGQGP